VISPPDGSISHVKALNVVDLPAPLIPSKSETFTIFETKRGPLNGKDRLSKETGVDLAELVDSHL
jgi:hypothetical protein